MKPPYKVTHRIVHLVAQITEELGKIEGSKFVSPEPKLRKQNRIRTIQATLAIEGNTLSLDQVTAVLEGKKVLGPKKEIIEVQNAVALYEELLLYKFYSVKDILRAHKKLMANLVDSNGRFRSKKVGVLKGSKVSHVAPKPRFVPELMQTLFKWVKSEEELHPLILSCILHYEIEFIHPFEDGNGRIGRFWQTLVLAQYNSIFSYLPVESLIRDNQKKYYDILERCDRVGDCTEFIEFVLALILSSIREFSASLSGLVLDPSQRLEKAKSFFADKLFSRKDYMAYFKNISSATASRDLKEGVIQGLLKTEGKDNQTQYRFRENGAG